MNRKPRVAITDRDADENEIASIARALTRGGIKVLLMAARTILQDEKRSAEEHPPSEAAK